MYDFNRGWLFVAMAALFFLGACDSTFEPVENEGQNGASNAGEDDDDRHMGPDRYDYVEPTGLEPGEAEPGIHLRPGIEKIRLGFGSEDSEVDVDPEEMTVTLDGEARELIEEFGGVWTDDILIGDDFIYLISGLREEDGEMVVEVEPFVFTRVIHGEWTHDLEPEDIGAELQMTLSIDDDDGFSIGEFIKDALHRTQSVGTETDDATYEVEGMFDWGIDGDISFPVKFGGSFDGKITRAGIELNEKYECETYTETVTERRFYVFGKYEEEVVREPEDFCVDELTANASVGVDFELLTTLDASANVTIAITDDFEIARQRVNLGQTGLALWFIPYLEGGMEVSLDGEVDLAIFTDGQFELPLGFEYFPHDTGFTLLPDRDSLEELGGAETDLVQAEGDVELVVDVFSGIGMNMHLSDVGSPDGARITGPEAGAKFGYDFTYAPFEENFNQSMPDRCAKAAVYLEAFGTMNLVGEVELGRWSWGVDITDAEWAEGTARGEIWTDNWPDDFMCILDGPDALEFRLKWQQETLLGLYVKSPIGTVLSPSDSLEAYGGTHEPVADDAACLDNSQDSCYAVTTWEWWEGGSPPVGTYKVWPVVLRGHEDQLATNFEIEMLAKDEYGEITDSKHVTDSLPGLTGANHDTEAGNHISYTFTVGD